MAMGVWKGRLRYEKNNNSDDNYMEIKSDQAAVATVDVGTGSTSVWSTRLRKASIASSRKTSGSTATKVDSINNTLDHSKVPFHSKEVTDE
jgi:2-keto-3-deoxy-galactonokinase